MSYLEQPQLSSLIIDLSGEDIMQVGVGIDYDQLTNTVYWSDIRYSVSYFFGEF